MNKYLTLARVLIRNGAMPGRSENRREKAVVLIVILAFLPVLCMEAVSLWNAYGTIAANHLTDTVLAGQMAAACVAMTLLGILYVISTYYFSDDTLLLLTMPIPSHRILAAKFTVVMLFQYWLEALIALPAFLVFGIRGGGLFYWISAILVLAALPLIPTAICSVISVLIMAFSRFFRNKDRVKFFAGLIAILVSVGITIPLQMLSNQSGSAAQALSSSSSAMEKTALLFPSDYLAVKAVFGGTAVSLLWLAAFLLLSAAAVAAFLFLGNKLYLRGVVGLSQSNVKTKSGSGHFQLKKRRPAFAVALKDWRLLCRTPAYSLNCLLGAFLVPAILVVTLAFTLHGGVTLPRGNILVISLSVLFLALISMTNSVSSTAVSRDGRDATLACMVPVRPAAQIFGKLLPGLGLSFAGLLVMVIPLCILLKPDSFAVASVCILSAVAVVTFNMFGLFLDLVSPKLDWDDETVAVKQNFNVAIVMFVMIVALGLPVFLVYKLRMSLQGGVIFLLIYNLILLAVAARLLSWKGSTVYGSAGLARKQVKKIADRQKTIRVVIGIVIMAAVLGVVGWEMFFVHTDVKITASEVSVSAGMGESSSFELSQIHSVYLKDSLPRVSQKIVGYASGAKMRGSFSVEGLGRGHLYTQNAKGPFLYIILKDGSFTVFNFDDSGKTESLYKALVQYAK